MSTICAALNSQRRLHWVIGIGPNRRVLGCDVSSEERDTLRQAFIYSVRSGIRPQLHPELVQLEFVSVENQHLNGNDARLLVTITIDHKVSMLYQVQPGRIFYVSKNEVNEVKGGINEALCLLSMKRKSDIKSVFDQASYGYLRFKASRNATSLGVLMKVSAYFATGLGFAFCARYLL
ncbi:unnamed protein product, partial [Strongylus vulgaris]